MLFIIASTVFAGSAVCISKVAPEMQFGVKHAPTRAAFSYALPGNLNALDLSGSGGATDEAATEAGPSSGTGSTEDGQGPTSGSGDTDPA